MPFKSERQRRWMWANNPEMAERWAREEKKKARRRKRKPLDEFKKRS
jgi:hypothetical protein